MRNKILIIKTGHSEILDDRTNSRIVSLGDVLRTTPLLHLYKEESVTWLTDPNAIPLLANNSLIGRVLPYDLTTVLQLQSEEFDTVVNLEKVPGICALADSIRARRSRFGFTFNSQTGEAEAYDKAYVAFAVGSNLSTKKENGRTVQQHIFEMVGAEWEAEEYSLGYLPKSIGEYDVALNTRIGPKWPTKAWPKKHWDKLEKILEESGIKVTRQDKQNVSVLTDLYSYMDWICSADVVVSNDSLGLHLGIAMKKKIIGLFGSSPHREMHFYGLGEAILAAGEYDCRPCMGQSCFSGKNCIESIDPMGVAEKIGKYLHGCAYRD